MAFVLSGFAPKNIPSDSDLSIFFQGAKEDPFMFLEIGCESGALKDKLEALIRSLVPDRLPPLVKEVKMGDHSGKLGCTINLLRSFYRGFFNEATCTILYFFNILYIV